MTSSDTQHPGPAMVAPLGADGTAGATAAPRRGVRIVLDARPMQDPERAPATSAYLANLLAAFDAAPLEGESFALLLQSDLDDPTTTFERLEVVGRRLLPPTRLLRSGALTVDPFLLRGASLGAAWRADRSGAAGAVYHAAAGAPPLFSRIPIVVTLLDLAPWELPESYQRSGVAQFGQRLRARLLQDAAAVIVGTAAVGRAAGRLLRVRRSRIRVIPLAARDAFRPGPPNDAGGNGSRSAAAVAANELAAERERLGLPERYLVYPGRYDARQDPVTFLRALTTLAVSSRPRGLPAGAAWPPRILVTGASPDDRAAIARLAAREEIADALVYAPALPEDRLAALLRGARAVVIPARSEAAGLAAIEALACGTPVVASAVGALPEIVGGEGILVEPGNAERLAAALKVIWADERVHRSLAGLARERALGPRRTWADVARETRQVYAEVGVRGG